MQLKICFFLLAGGIIMAGCNQREKATVIRQDSVKKPVVMDPFRFHKLIEVSPGQYYDVLSWGRGSVDTGSFMILHSDSTGKKYLTTTGDLNGAITDVYNTDLDVDGNPEILIQAKKKDTVNYTSIYAFEFSNNKAQKIDFPKLTVSQRKGYRGGDNFYVQEGKFIREFPVYEGSGKDARLTTQRRKLEYGISDNSFTVKQLSKDSTSKASKITAKEPVVKKEETKKESKKETKKETKSKKKHHQQEEEPHKKSHKKHHHHNSDDN